MTLETSVVAIPARYGDYRWLEDEKKEVPPGIDSFGDDDEAVKLLFFVL